jgi:hypothetical protein
VAVLLDLGAGVALLTGLIIAIAHARPMASGAASRRVAVRWAWGLGSGLAALIALNVTTFGYGEPQGPGTLTTAVITGTWNAGFIGPTPTIRFLPDGTFTATGLPPDVDPATGLAPALPADERGTWRIARGGGTWYVLGSLTGGPQFTFTIDDLPVPVTGEFRYADNPPDITSADVLSKQL